MGFAPIAGVLGECQGAAALSPVVPTLLGWGPGPSSVRALLSQVHVMAVTCIDGMEEPTQLFLLQETEAEVA